MNPYAILGVGTDAGLDEIKQAYRREAMKWHPDRCNHSVEAKERFQQAAEAYRILAARHSANGGPEAAARGQSRRAGADTASAPGADSAANDASRGDASADSIFWDVMLDHAIGLAQSGLNRQDITTQIIDNGCPQRLASMIAEKASAIHAHYTANRRQGEAGGGAAGRAEPAPEQRESDLLRAFVGERNYFWGPRAIEYYLNVFGKFARASKLNPLARLRPNPRLFRILNISIVLLLALAIALQLLPESSRYRLFDDVVMLQIPLLALVSMFVWSVYRKLWYFSILFLLFYGASLFYFNLAMPAALASGWPSVLRVAALCLISSLIMVLSANYIYFLKAKRMLGAAARKFDDHYDRLEWIGRRAGTSSVAAFVFLVVFAAALVYVAPWDSERFGLVETGTQDKAEAAMLQRRLQRAGKTFEIAEAYFYQTPPDYDGAERAYTSAAGDGSLLAAYKLGYLYYSGIGVERNDLLALEYFRRALEAPLAFQPHRLELTTRFLAESYNNLGIMFQYGYGTDRDMQRAREMYRQAVDYGSAGAQKNLARIDASNPATGRIRLLEADFR